MDKTMSTWSRVLKHKIVKNDDFIEDYGYINEADIANWFKTLEQTFEEMLLRVGISPSPETIEELYESLEADSNFKPRLNKRLSFNQKQIRDIGQDIAYKILTEGMEAFMTEYSNTLEDDSERSISTMLGSQPYNDTLEALFDLVEMILSSIFDSCYETVRVNMDDPEFWDNDDVEDAPIDIDAPLSDEIVNQITESVRDTLNETIPNAVSNAVNTISRNLTGNKSVIAEAIKDKLLEKMKDGETELWINQFTAYCFQSFWIKYPLMQLSMSRNKQVADDDEYTPDGQLEQDDPEEYKRRRDDFEEFNRSEHNGNYNDKLKWESILSKESGTGMTTSTGFSPAIHNLTYGAEEKSSCGECEDKTTSCGCGE